MTRVRKKPVEVEAEQLTWQNWNSVCELAKPEFEAGTVVGGVYVAEQGYVWGEAANRSVSDDSAIALKIETLEGTMVADENDWIIRGVAGELYPCKPDIFDQTYEPAE